MLDIPMEILLSAARVRIRNPLVLVIVEITALGTATWVLQPIPVQRLHERMSSPLGKKPPRILCRPSGCLAHDKSPTPADVAPAVTVLDQNMNVNPS
jgi:hypothetical protein